MAPPVDHEAGESPDSWFQIRIVDELGQTVETVPTAVAPLALEDILRACSPTDRSLQLEFATNAAMVDGEQLPGRRTLRASISFHQPLRIYALVRGGWVPPPLVLPPMFLVDRNFVATTRHLLGGHRRQDSAELEWWMALLKGDTVWFNPLPCAMEGRERRTPTFDEFVDEFCAASNDMIALFPGAKIVAYEQRHFEAAYQIVANLGHRASNEASFLLETVGLIVHQTAPHDLPRVRAEIISLARKHLTAQSSLVLIAALSCLYDNDSFTMGRSVLKPSGDYSPASAHNALSDLRLVELAAVSQGVPELGTFSLCTRDRGLALFWCGVSPRFGAWHQDKPSITLNLDQRLFPKLQGAELDELFEMIQKFGADRRKRR